MTSPRLFRSFALVACLALFVVSCGDDDDGSTNGQDSSTTIVETSSDTENEEQSSTTTVDDVELSASYRGVTKDTIKVGVVLFDLDAILALGVDVGFGDQQAHYDVAFDALNEAGGILGRQVEPIYKFISPVSAADSDLACTQLVEDEEVFLVLGTQRPAENVWCYTKRADTPFIGALQSLTDATFEESTVPVIHQGKSPMRTDESILAAMEDADAVEGEVVSIYGRDGVRMDEFETVLLDAGAESVVTTVATANEIDQVGLAQELDVFVEKFDAEGVTQSINLSDNVAYLAAFNRNAFATPVWTTSPDVLSEFWSDQGATDAELRLVNYVGGSVSPYESGHEPTVECVDRWNELRPDEVALANPGDDDLTNLGPVTSACFQVEFLELAATAAGPDLTVESFTAALDDVGSFETAALPMASVSSTKWDVADAISVRSYDESTGELDTIVVLEA
ncbi:MAG: hypothetical protein IH940_13975 [Acidobacteria bacterium]|nr:hypothetical protein [Acidobacteriota bacterium]